MKKIKDELKKKLVAYLDEWLWEGEYDRANTEDIVDDILNPKVFPEIAVVDRDAELYPTSVYTTLKQEGWVKEVE